MKLKLTNDYKAVKEDLETLKKALLDTPTDKKILRNLIHALRANRLGYHQDCAHMIHATICLAEEKGV